MSEFKFETYDRYVKLINLVKGHDAKYPYTLNSDVKFIQNEIMLRYKQNYAILDKNNQSEKKQGGSGYNVSVWLI